MVARTPTGGRVAGRPVFYHEEGSAGCYFPLPGVESSSGKTQIVKLPAPLRVVVVNVLAIRPLDAEELQALKAILTGKRRKPARDDDSRPDN